MSDSSDDSDRKMKTRSHKKTGRVSQAELYERLRKRLKEVNGDESDSADEKAKKPVAGKRPKHAKQTYLLGNKHASKETKKIEIGWYHNGVSVRGRTGGGTRKIRVKQDAIPTDLIKEARNLFFNNGVSAKGIIESDCTFVLKDFCHMEIDEQETVNMTYERVRPSGILRYYMYSTCSEKETKQAPTHTKSKPNLEEELNVSPFEASNDSAKESPGTGLDAPKVLSLQSHALKPTDSTAVYLVGGSTETYIGNLEQNSFLANVDEVRAIQIGACQDQFSDYDDFTRTAMSANIVTDVEIASQSAFTYDVTDPNNPKITPRGAQSETLSQTIPLESPNVLPQNNVDDECRSPTPPPPMDSITNAAPNDADRLLRIRRVVIEQDMIFHFKDPSIVMAPVTFQFVDERGIDIKGLSREAYSAFWENFMEKSAKGEAERVPAIQPHFQKSDWEAVGRILVKGFLDHGVFPLQLSKAFSIVLLFGEEQLNAETLLTSFYSYVTETEKDVIQKVLDGTLDDEDDKEELFDIMVRCESKKIPDISDKDGMKLAMIQIAQKELIQVGKYALDSLIGIAREPLTKVIEDKETLTKIYEEKTPTVKKILKMLVQKERGIEEDKTFGFLKQYIKGLSAAALKKFLRHVTGAEIIAVSELKIHFNKNRGLSRVPVARTCAGILELPTTYASFQEFRYEFNMILSGAAHEIDID